MTVGNRGAADHPRTRIATTHPADPRRLADRRRRLHRGVPVTGWPVARGCRLLGGCRPLGGRPSRPGRPLLSGCPGLARPGLPGTAQRGQVRPCPAGGAWRGAGWPGSRSVGAVRLGPVTAASAWFITHSPHHAYPVGPA
ncbi:hypothetical protein GCM10023259_092040 [Thermocatellispora tengchongensis]